MTIGRAIRLCFSAAAISGLAATMLAAAPSGAASLDMKERAAPPMGNRISTWSSVSGNGRYVVFVSRATNLVTGDTNGFDDIFIRDRVARTTKRVSTNATGGQANRGSFYPSVSADGRYVAFASDATNLVTGDTNGVRDVFRKDMTTGAIVRVSVSAAGQQATMASGQARVSANGAVVAFASAAPTLTAGDTNGKVDAFLKTVSTGAIRLISKAPGGGQSTADVVGLDLSPDGRRAGWVADNCPGYYYGTVVEWTGSGTRRVHGCNDDGYDTWTVRVSNAFTGYDVQSEDSTDNDIYPRGGKAYSIYVWGSVGFTAGWDVTPDARYAALSQVDRDSSQLSELGVWRYNNGWNLVKSVNIASLEPQGPASYVTLSDNASVVAFQGIVNDVGQIYAWVPATGARELISTPTG